VFELPDSDDEGVAYLLSFFDSGNPSHKVLIRVFHVILYRAVHASAVRHVYAKVSRYHQEMVIDFAVREDHFPDDRLHMECSAV
jgi:hypothetical protein